MSRGAHVSTVSRVAFGCALTVAFLFTLAATPDEKPADAKPAPVDFATQIKPIFAAHCNDCHAAGERKSGLRLDTGELAIRGGDRGPAIIPGKSDESILFQAIIGKGDVKAMPEGADCLAEKEIALVKRWIDEGAKVPHEEIPPAAQIKSDHWAFQPIKRSALPAVKNPEWVRNPIDAFILARLEADGLKPSLEADRATLIRRMSLDLRGITPSITEVDEFLGDARPDAYERLVQRMIDSPHYGERWGRHWLDAARYADSNGFTIDSARSIWKYRDWVIGAINDNMPFDAFTTEQLAGDLLPNATPDQLIATGFHRNTLINEEGGTDDEQFRVESIDDRVNTTGSVFLGLTVGCAQCHAHKFDPISQREYYEIFAIFNNCEEPNYQVPTPQQSVERNGITEEIAAVEKQLQQRDAEFLKGMPAWEQSLASLSAGEWTNLDPSKVATKNGSLLTKLDDKSYVVDFSVPATDTFTLECNIRSDSITALRLEALTHPSLPMMGPGRAANGNFVLSEVEVDSQALDAAGRPIESQQKVKIAKAVADHSQVGYSVSAAIDGNLTTGWSINVDSGSLNLDREAVFIIDGGIRNPHGSALTVQLHQNHTDAGSLLGRFRLSVSTGSPAALEIPGSVRRILETAKDKRTAEQQKQLEALFKQTDAARKPLADRFDALKNKLEKIDKRIPTTMIVREMKQPRESFIHIRGDFLRHGARVKGNVPAVLPPLPSNVEVPTRLDFAHWLTDPRQPLTSRVIVNRFWQQFFGAGLVMTENDFGTQGSPPTHPELLDWLASEFMRNEWSMKSLHKLIVTSATYRQSSQTDANLLARDPANRLLARQSRVRLEAEIIRDVGLSSSGLLTDEIGGPSVHPPQPEGIYVLTQQKKAWPEEQGAERYRRGMYTQFWRSSPYPLLPTFDAPDANTTCTRRVRSNTPLQSLTLANDRAFIELSQGLAARVLSEPAASDVERLRLVFRLCFSREPNDNERERLVQYLDSERSRFAADPKAAEEVAPTARPAQVAAAEGAAWTAVARVLQNLDEFITRE